MSYAIISWEVSTGDPGRAVRISQAAEQALAAFNPAQLLVACVMVDTERQNVEIIRRALDAVVRSFPQEFFFTASDQVEADIQGTYPPFADLGAAHAITGQARNPLPRQAPAPIPGIAARATARSRPRVGAAVPAGGTGRRRKAARKTATRKAPARPRRAKSGPR